MADFSTFEAKAKAFGQAVALVSVIRSIYTQASSLKALIAAYQGNTDPNLVAAINAAFTQAQRQEIASVVQALANIATDLEQNHTSLIGKA